jgi:hypothetical protein
VLHSFSIANHKCFSKAVTLELSKHWNVIVGKNNSGKSSLLKALKIFELSDRPYRGISQKRGEAFNPHSLVRYVAQFSGEDVCNEIRRQNLPFPVALVSNATAAHEQILNELFVGGHLIVSGEFGNSTGHHVLHAKDQRDTLIFDRELSHSYYSVPDFLGNSARYTQDVDIKQVVANLVAHLYVTRFYWFSAERMHINDAEVKNDTNLQPDAGNLAQVVNKLHENTFRYKRYISEIREIFPEISDVVPCVVNSGRVEIRCKRRLRPIGYTGFAAAVEERVSF